MSEYKRIYVWEWSVRFFHWINALCIVVLAATGYMIGEPMAIFPSAEAYSQFWFGKVRFVHFATAYIFTFNIIFRLYWSFVGNQYSKWSNYIPHNTRQLKEIKEVVKVDLLLQNIKTKLSVGHNSLAYLSYFFIMLVSMVQIISGFVLYNDNSKLTIPSLIALVVAIAFVSVSLGYVRARGKGFALSLIMALAIGAVSYFALYMVLNSLIVEVSLGDMLVRNIHHIIMWIFLLFAIVHIYLVFFHDYLEARGTMSSMIGGWKFIKDKELDRDDK